MIQKIFIIILEILEFQVRGNLMLEFRLVKDSKYHVSIFVPTVIVVMLNYFIFLYGFY